MAVITRPVLDPALLKVAAAAGAETRFGEKVTGLLGAGTDADPVRGVVLGSGEEIEARWVLGADGRVSTVARLLGLEKERQLAGEMAFMFGYWRGLPPIDQFKIDVIEEGPLGWSPAEEARADLQPRGHYAPSFAVARSANPDPAAPIFRGLVADPEAGQNLRDALSRQLRPKEDVFTKERLNRWFSAVPSAR